MLKMVDGTGIIGVDMVCPLGGAVSPPQPPNYDNIEMEGVGSLMLPNSLKAPLERVELIGNSVQGENPSPDNPQEIKSVGRKSKNLLIENISVFTVQDNIAYIPLPEGHETKQYTMLIQKKPGENDDVGFTCGFYDKSNMAANYAVPCLQAGNLVTGNGIVNSKIGVNHFVCFSPADSGFFDIYNVMYVEGKETTLDYEPYGYFFDLKITGKNLLSNKSADWQIGKGTSWSTYPQDAIIIYSVINSAVNVINLKPSTTYSIVNNSGEIVISRIIERGSSENGIKDHDVRHSKYTFVTNQNTMNAILQFKKVDGTELLSSDIESNKIMLVEGEANEPTPHEPYTEQSVQIALNEPLRGIGEYKDMLTKDGVVRKIKRIVFDENTPFKEYNAPVQVKTTSFISGTTIKDATGETGIEVMPDRFKAKDRGFDRYDEECITLFGKSIFVRFNKDKNINTAEALTEWLKQNPLTVDYVLAEPVTEPLPESVQQQLQALHSENGTTHINIDSGEVEAGIKLTYRKEI